MGMPRIQGVSGAAGQRESKEVLLLLIETPKVGLWRVMSF